MNRKARGTLRILMIPLTISVGAAIAADYDLDWWTVDGGGDMWTAAADFELSGTIAQPDANAVVMTGGQFELSGGFWPGVEEFCFADLNGDNTIGLGDLAILLSNYGTTSGMNYLDGDLDYDGDVDLADLAELLSVYGTLCP